MDRKEQSGVLDYDDLLLFWRGLLADEQAGRRVRERFDCVLVDEHQDTNRLQAEILKLLRPDGQGLSAVGDDAQSIYSFRATTVRNILDFPQDFPGTRVVLLEQNYRSTSRIPSATNAVIAEAKERFAKTLWSTRTAGEKPLLVPCDDESEQVDYLVRQILEHREAGIELRKQAVLFRASHHSILLEGELLRRKIPFVKYGGLKFMEAAHVKDLMAFLRLAENSRDVVFVIHAADGCIPSDLATKTPEEIDEERRLFYVALTPAKDWLYVTHPLRYFFASRGRSTDLHGYAQLTRFLTPEAMEHFERRLAGTAVAKVEWGQEGAAAKRASIREQSRAMWQ